MGMHEGNEFVSANPVTPSLVAPHPHPPRSALSQITENTIAETAEQVHNVKLDNRRAQTSIAVRSRRQISGVYVDFHVPAGD